MLKGIKNATIIIANKEETIKNIFAYYQAYDNINKTKMSEEFYYVFIDEKPYTMQKIGDLTGNSICTIRRHIRYFNKLIDYENSNQKV